MRFHALPLRQFAKALLVGFLTAIIVSAFMIPLFEWEIPPMPMQPARAFADLVLGPGQPAFVGFLFHLVYVTVWSVIYVSLAWDRLSFPRAAGLAAILWLIALLVFFPLLGWGFLGLAIGPKLIVAAILPHLLFAIALWVLCKLAFRRDRLVERE